MSSPPHEEPRFLHIERDDHSTDDEDRQLERAVGEVIDEALGQTSDCLPTTVTARELLQSGTNDDGEVESEVEDDDLFGDESNRLREKVMVPLLAPSAGHDSGPNSQSPCSQPMSIDASAASSTSSLSPTGLALPWGSGRPITRSSASPQARESTVSSPGVQPQGRSSSKRAVSQEEGPIRGIPPSHLPKRLSGGDFKRLRRQREAEYKEAEEKLRRGEITQEQMPPPIRTRMSKRKREMLKEQQELEGAVWNVRSIHEDRDGAGPIPLRRDSVHEREPSRAGSNGLSISPERRLPSTVNSPVRPSPLLPAPSFSVPLSQATPTRSLPTPRSLLNIVLKPGPERSWMSAAASIDNAIPPQGPPRRRCDDTIPGAKNSPPSSHTNDCFDTLERSEGLVTDAGPTPTTQLPHHRDQPLFPFPASDASPTPLPVIEEATNRHACSAYTAPLRQQLTLARQKIETQVKTHQTDVNKLKLEFDVLKNAGRIVDSRILELERRKRERLLARPGSQRDHHHHHRLDE